MSVIKAIWRRPPKLENDKGFVWLILVMSFISHSVHLGFTYGVLGNLTVVHQTFFNIDLQLSSFIGSVFGGVTFIFAPIASVMVKKIGCRISQIFGGTCLILGIGLSSLSTQPWHAFLLFGVLAGIGTSTTYIATSEVLALNFNRFKYLAFSLAILGYYLGMVVFPIVTQKLFDQFGYSKAMGIMSAFHIIHIIAGLVFFQPNASDITTGDSKGKISDEEDIRNASSTQDDTRGKTSSDNPALDVSEIDVSEGGDKDGEKREQNAVSEPVGDAKYKKTVETTNLKQDFLILLRSPQVWAILINAMLWSLNVVSFLILINDFALQQTGVTKDEAAFGITVIGIANIVGCFIVISVSSLKFDRLMLHFSCTSTFGIATVIIAFSTEKMMLYAVSALWGLAQGASIGNLLGVLDDFCDVKHLALLLAVELFSEGIGALGGAPLCSYVSKQAGAQYGIILAGCVGIAGSLCILPVIIQRVRKRKRLNSKSDDDNSETVNTKL